MKTTKSAGEPVSALRRRAELALQKPEFPGSAADKLLHELQVHQVELQMQNEELRHAQIALEESRSRYVDLYEFAPVGYLTLTRGALIEAINLTGASLLGVDRPQLIDHRFAPFVAAADHERWRHFFGELLERHDRQRCELRMQRADGGLFHAQLDCQYSERATGTIRLALTDVSERKRAEEDLSIAALAFESEVGIVITDPHGIILRVNRAFARLTGHSAQDAVGRTPGMLNAEGQSKDFEDRVRRELLGAGYWQGEIWNRSDDGRRYAAWLTISAVRGTDGATTHYVGTFSEITEVKEAEAEVHRLAYFDPLTRMPNRRLLYDRIGQAMAASTRSKAYGALIFLDLDHFKTLNDTRGHELGDRLLIEAAHRIQTDLRQVDTVARLGGDEFVVVLEHLSVDQHAAAVEAGRIAETIRGSLAWPYKLGGDQIRCSASLGVALFRGHEQSIDLLLRHADQAMYHAKSEGRNTLRFFDPAMQALRRQDEGPTDDAPA
jgi:diguanylate cyclase (GGDEF)-like protein/PAS domain S-box-containing protein